MKLEELARQSSVAARTSVSRHDPPPIGDSARPRWLAPAFAVAALAALIIGGLVLLDRRGDAESVPATVPVVADPPRLALGADVADWIPAGATALDDVEVDPIATLPYYGTAGADHPFAAGDLLLGWVADGEEPGPDDGESIEVRGHPAVLSDGQQELGFEVTLISWSEETSDGVLDMVAGSRSMSRAELLAVVEALTIDTAARRITPADDLELDLLTTSTDLPLAGFRGATGWTVTYVDTTASDDPILIVSSTAGDIRAGRIPQRWWSNELVVVDTDLGDAHMTTLAIDGGSANPLRIETFDWSPEPGIVATLRYVGADDVDLVALAGEVVELTPPEWAELVERVNFPDFGDGDDGAFVEGPIGRSEIIADVGGEVDGLRYHWTLSASSTDLCFDIETDGSGSGSCGGPEMSVPPTGSARVVFGDFGGPVTAVVAVADPEVDLLSPIDDRVTIDRIEWNGSSWFVAVGPGDTDHRYEVVRDGDVVEMLAGEPRPAEPAAVGDAPVDGREATLAQVDGVDHWLTLELRDAGLCLGVARFDGGFEECAPLDRVLAPAVGGRVVISFDGTDVGTPIQVEVIAADPSVESVAARDGVRSTLPVDVDGTVYFLSFGSGRTSGYDLFADDQRLATINTE